MEDRRDPAGMDPGEIAREIQENTEEIVRIGLSIKEISWWDKSMWGLGAVVGIGGVVAAPPTGGLSLFLTVLSFVLLYIDVAKKVSEVADNTEKRSRVAYLRARNDALWEAFKQKG